MVNIFSLIFLIAIAFLIVKIISRKQRELLEKELQQKEQLLQEMQSILKTETPLSSEPAPTDKNESTNNYHTKVAEYFKTNGYNITETSKAEGIDLIGIKEKELLLIRCEEKLKEIKKIDIKLFIAECSVYVDNNPMFRGRSCIRYYITNRPITDEARHYLRENPSSIRILEDI